MANENRAVLPPSTSGDVSPRLRLFLSLFTTSCTRGLRPFISDCVNVSPSRSQGSLARLRFADVLFSDSYGTNAPAYVPYVRYNPRELLAARVPLLLLLLLLLLPRSLPLYFLEKLHPRTFARTRIRYSPLARIYSTGYRARGTYCRGLFGAIFFCFRNVLQR